MSLVPQGPAWIVGVKVGSSSRNCYFLLQNNIALLNVIKECNAHLRLLFSRCLLQLFLVVYKQEEMTVLQGIQYLIEL